MEKLMACNGCVCKPVCEIYRATGGVNTCEFYCHERPFCGKPRAKWKLSNFGKGTCSRCNFTQTGVWDFDHHQRFCGVCGAEMELEVRE